MVKLINKRTLSIMWVADNRVDEYLAAGHKPADAVTTTAEEEKAEPKAEPKATKKKATSTKKRG